QEAVVMRALDHPHAVPAVRVLEMAVLDDAVARVREFREMLDSRVRPDSLTVDVHAVDDDVGAAGEIDRGCEPVLLPRGEHRPLALIGRVANRRGARAGPARPDRIVVVRAAAKIDGIAGL